MSTVYKHFIDGFERAIVAREFEDRRIGAELKFPLVNLDGTAADLRTVQAFWRYLVDDVGDNGSRWKPIQDRVTNQLAGARRAGQYNDTVASCETGYCKTEFSLAHVGNLFKLKESIAQLRRELEPFADEHGVRFLGYGIQPLTPPSKALLFKKERSCFWDKALPSNRHIRAEDGDDVHLFTVNAGSHVHLSVEPEDAVRAVNVLNGFAGPQIALTAHSPVWKGRADGRYKCVNEVLWDWWKPAQGRSGVPRKAFEDLRDYVRSIELLPPIYVKRDGQPIILRKYKAFGDYYGSGDPSGETTSGEAVAVVPKTDDIRTHNSCYWYNARISQYYTVENRVCDQQPPNDLECVAALTLGLVAALDEAWAEVSGYPWSVLRSAREVACRDGLGGDTDELSLREMAGRMLEIAELGLSRRGLGEEEFLRPLRSRLEAERCPADRAAAVFRKAGVEGLVEALAL